VEVRKCPYAVGAEVSRKPRRGLVNSLVVDEGELRQGCIGFILFDAYGLGALLAVGVLTGFCGARSPGIPSFGMTDRKASARAG
jgi:hypothetical protein